MLKNMKITHKFPLVMILFALISAFTTGVVAYLQASNSIKSQAESNLYSLLESRESSLERYFENIERDIHHHANSGLVKSAFNDFSSAWKKLPGKPYDHLNQHYQVRNPYAFDQYQFLLKAEDGSAYSASHAKHHSDFTSLIASGFYYDLFLIDASGNVVYTVKKENDFATNLVNGPWSKSGLANAFLMAQANVDANMLNFIDFSPYGPSQFENASFVSKALYDSKANFVGVLALQLSIEKLDQVMQVTAGMGESGETYLVGPDLTMRSDSRFYSSSSILKVKVDTQPVNMALGGKEGVMVAQDYRGINVYSAFKSFDVFGNTWAILAEIDESEVLAPVKNLNNFLIAAGSIIAVLIALFGYLFASDLANPIRSMTKTMKRLSNNDLATNISVDERSDEVGLMARALIEFKKSALEQQKLKQHLSHMANHDSLTGLPNRDYILPLIKSKTDNDNFNNTGLTIMFADLDNFKQVNDQYGHFFADELLKQVSSRMQNNIRKGDVVARLGGDEFLIMLSDNSVKKDGAAVAEQLIAAMATPFAIGAESISIGISIGAATFPQDTRATNELLRIADQAMYIAKSQGKNCFVEYSEELFKSTNVRFIKPKR